MPEHVRYNSMSTETLVFLGQVLLLFGVPTILALFVFGIFPEIKKRRQWFQEFVEKEKKLIDSINSFERKVLDCGFEVLYEECLDYYDGPLAYLRVGRYTKNPGEILAELSYDRDRSETVNMPFKYPVMCGARYEKHVFADILLCITKVEEMIQKESGE